MVTPGRHGRRSSTCPPGPPLGLGGLPFEAAELELPEGSLLALYTDGLVEARDRDIDAGLDRLRRRPGASPRPYAGGHLRRPCCGTLLPDHPADDVALLLARTHALDADQVATWDLPADPAVVAAGPRARPPRSWPPGGWTDAAFTTELVVSELVTNAIRYGTAPDPAAADPRPHA